MSDIIRKLQQKIDKRSNWITANEAKYKKDWHIAWREVIDDQTLDKRLMGELVKTERERKRLAKMLFKAMLSIYKKEK